MRQGVIGQERDRALGALDGGVGALAQQRGLGKQ